MAASSQSRPWILRVFGRKSVPALDPARQDLEVVAFSFDDAEACSTALERAQSQEPVWEASQEALFRHFLVLPEAAIADAAEIVAQDGYRRGDLRPGDESASSEGGVRVVFERVQVLDALHCSQERSRMAGLAQRLGGSVVGWDGLQPPAVR